MQLSRRHFLLGMAIMPLIPTHEPYKRRHIEQVASISRRIASFEETAVAVIKWVEKNQFKPEALLRFEEFKSGLSFEIDGDVETLVKSTAGQKNKKGFAKKKGYIFELGVDPRSKTLTAFFGKIGQEATIGRYEVYVLDFVTGNLEEVTGWNVAGTNRVYVDKEKITGITFSLENRLLGYEFVSMNKDRIFGILNKQPFGWEEFFLFCREMAEKYNISLENVARILTSLKLTWKDKENYNGFETEKDRQRAIRDFTFSVLIHEIMHGELDRFIDTGTKQITGIDSTTHEVLGVLTELGYGKRQYRRLAELLTFPLDKKAPTNYVLLSYIILDFLEKLGYEPKEIANISSEEEIRRLGLKMLQHFCIGGFGLSYEQVVDVSLFEEAGKFVESIDVN